MAKAEAARAGKDGDLPQKSDAWTDLGLTLPIFVLYHLGVVFLPIRNAADPVTSELKALAKHSLPMYGAFTLAIGVVFVGVLWMLGQRRALSGWRFVWIALEGALYAVLMRFAGSYVVGSLRLVPGADGEGVFGNVVMALGAGFYEEILFRVGIFGVGAILLRKVLGKGGMGFLASVGWAIIAASVFSGWHYFGALGDSFELKSFVFRMVCGLVLTAIYAFRGFAPAVWTHAIYDLWVMVLG
jgi:hypothetical protein